MALMKPETATLFKIFFHLRVEFSEMRFERVSALEFFVAVVTRPSTNIGMRFPVIVDHGNRVVSFPTDVTHETLMVQMFLHVFCEVIYASESFTTSLKAYIKMFIHSGLSKIQGFFKDF